MKKNTKLDVVRKAQCLNREQMPMVSQRNRVFEDRRKKLKAETSWKREARMYL